MGLRQTVTTRQAALNYNPRLDLEPPSWRWGVREVGGCGQDTRSDLPKTHKNMTLQNLEKRYFRRPVTRLSLKEKRGSVKDLSNRGWFVYSTFDLTVKLVS